MNPGPAQGIELGQNNSRRPRSEHLVQMDAKNSSVIRSNSLIEGYTVEISGYIGGHINGRINGYTDGILNKYLSMLEGLRI